MHAPRTVRPGCLLTVKAAAEQRAKTEEAWDVSRPSRALLRCPQPSCRVSADLSIFLQMEPSHKLVAKVNTSCNHLCIAYEIVVCMVVPRTAMLFTSTRHGSDAESSSAS